MALGTGRNRADDRAFNGLNQESEEEENCGDNSFNSLDDFVVSDNDDLSFHETSDSDTQEESQKAFTPSPPPKSARKRLMRGRKPMPSTGGEIVAESPSKSSFSLEPRIPDTVKVPSLSKNGSKHSFQDDLQLSTKLNKLDLDDENGADSQLATDLAQYASPLAPRTLISNSPSDHSPTAQ